MKTQMMIMSENVIEAQLHALLQTMTNYLDLWLNAIFENKNKNILQNYV